MLPLSSKDRERYRVRSCARAQGARAVDEEEDAPHKMNGASFWRKKQQVIERSFIFPCVAREVCRGAWRAGAGGRGEVGI